jgi:hypothetical protein
MNEDVGLLPAFVAVCLLGLVGYRYLGRARQPTASVTAPPLAIA